ncbi:1,2-phenylacetyl-CoA epoxidase subunit PaaE [Halomonas sp. KM-1]|uniref:1,2-phenylacetyl-CoA epoxidase subunit PaaE n=1 Tax=Halomonas sp. KM-1 TaxID=590061 RepID=UPI0002890291|nr:1,2-phenylacetyl-CoA epoxidase subunit PaaE [Halomonas sp. KM-1]
MSRFHDLTVRDIRKETSESVSIAFEVPESLHEAFRFTQGQYLTLRREIAGEEVRRSYSICTGVHEGEIRVAVKLVPGGAFSTFANHELAVGDTLQVMPPQGKFFVPLDPSRKGHYLAVAAGSGITPILSIISTTLETEPMSRFTLVYGNFSTSTTMFRERLQDLKNRHMERLNLIHIFNREEQDIELYNGIIDAEKCRTLFDRWLDVRGLEAAFLCGPQEMSTTVREVLQEYCMPVERIHLELFGSRPNASARRQTTPGGGQATAGSSHIKVIIDGRTLEFDLPRNTRSILEAGNEHGADLPFSCKAGVCSTCLAKVEEGEVEMDANFALEDYEIAAGMVLSCQCYPVSEKVVLNYDEV